MYYQPIYFLRYKNPIWKNQHFVEKFFNLHRAKFYAKILFEKRSAKLPVEINFKGQTIWNLEEELVPEIFEGLMEKNA